MWGIFPRCQQDPGKDNLSLHESKENLSEIRALVIKNISEPFGSHPQLYQTIQDANSGGTACEVFGDSA